MAAHSRNYDVLGDDQKCILSSFYDNGMTSTAKDMGDTVMKAADKAGTSCEKVKVRKFNELRDCFTLSWLLGLKIAYG